MLGQLRLYLLHTGEHMENVNQWGKTEPITVYWRQENPQSSDIKTIAIYWRQH